MRQHTGRQGFVCMYCDADFQEFKALTSHLEFCGGGAAAGNLRPGDRALDGQEVLGRGNNGSGGGERNNEFANSSNQSETIHVDTDGDYIELKPWRPPAYIQESAPTGVDETTNE